VKHLGHLCRGLYISIFRQHREIQCAAFLAAAVEGDPVSSELSPCSLRDCQGRFRIQPHVLQVSLIQNLIVSSGANSPSFIMPTSASIPRRSEYRGSDLVISDAEVRGYGRLESATWEPFAEERFQVDVIYAPDRMEIHLRVHEVPSDQHPLCCAQA